MKTLIKDIYCFLPHNLCIIPVKEYTVNALIEWECVLMPVENGFRVNRFFTGCKFSIIIIREDGTKENHIDSVDQNWSVDFHPDFTRLNKNESFLIPDCCNADLQFKTITIF